MNSAGKWCAILCLATSVVAQTSTPPKPKKARAAATASEVQALKEAVAAQQAALAAQQQEIQALRDELHHKDQAVNQVQATAADAAAKADAAQATASQQQATVTELKSDVADLKTNVNNTALSIQETQKNVKAEIESPIALHYKGITITPGGFAAAEFVRRSRALGSDINTPFNSLTMPGASQSAISEFFGSGRQSRISALAEGKLASAKLSGYVEADFLSAAVTSNNNESNSYLLRQRQAWDRRRWTTASQSRVGYVKQYDELRDVHKNLLVFLYRHQHMGGTSAISDKHGAIAGGALCFGGVLVELPTGKGSDGHGVLQL